MPSPPLLMLAELGTRMRDAGLRERAAIAAYGGATGIHAARLAPRRPPLTKTSGGAGVALELWVAGRAVDAALAERALGDLEPALAAGILARRGGQVAAPIRAIPFRERLLVCEPTALPDDSSLHLLGALPDHCDGGWLDVGTGCGVAPLCRPRLGAARVGSDIDGRAVELAAIGAALSGLDGVVELVAGDLFEAEVVASGRFSLVSFNAPLPLPADLLGRFFAGAAEHLEPGGEVVVHAAIAGPPPQLAGEAVCLRYTPAGASTPFSVLRWRPDRAARSAAVAVELTARAPHISRAMFDRC